MTVETFCLGDLDTNAYLVSEEGAPECLVIDCPGEPQALIVALSQRKARPLAVLLTHAHVDHIAGLEEFRRAFPGTPVYQHPLEADWLGDPQKNLSGWFGLPMAAQPAEVLLEGRQTLALGPWTLKTLHVPGHSPGSLAYWFEADGEVFSGDVLFRSGVGRWDFPGCDPAALRQSLERLTALPDATRVRPGHGGSTTIGHERASNPYLRSEEPWGF